MGGWTLRNGWLIKSSYMAQNELWACQPTETKVPPKIYISLNPSDHFSMLIIPIIILSIIFEYYFWNQIYASRIWNISKKSSRTTLLCFQCDCEMDTWKVGLGLKRPILAQHKMTLSLTQTLEWKLSDKLGN